MADRKESAEEEATITTEMAEEEASPRGPRGVEADEPEETVTRECGKCGARFSGEDANKLYRAHMQAFHPSAG